MTIRTTNRCSVAQIIAQLSKRMLGDRTGVAAVEMALATPLLMVMLGGTVEVTRVISVHYEVAQMTNTVSDAVARYENGIDASVINALFSVSSDIVGTSDFKDNGYVVLSSVARAKGAKDAKVAWQCKGGGALVSPSAIGKIGQIATLPNGLTIDEDDNVIVAEVFYKYRPILTWLPISESVVYKTAVFRPRLGSLTTAPGC
ncbi:TadE/TadG family type IV pilus assembly protein [Consotaella salsifontis]|uniref:TadE-like protein n=1 Tax=Consotaella salsifontis TaxID=1365950 RepID=A0A1T4T7N4_9HYPH|nr:TadE/TadG family type IV pilus assembly protein [Consotaella salsifontis]SKA36359.1 TadE-like protein [Consotaella salsifontis]